jgi:hypothetical protein
LTIDTHFRHQLTSLTLLYLFFAVDYFFAALYHQSFIIATGSNIALLTSLGFNVIYVPGVLEIGYRRDDLIGRTTLTSGLLLAIHILLKAFRLDQSYPLVAVFESSAFFCNSFVLHLSLLIIGSEHYVPHHSLRSGVTVDYLSRQAIAMACYSGSIYLGMILNLTSVWGFGLFFAALFVMEKMYEWAAYAKLSMAWILVAMGSLCIALSFEVYSMLHNEPSKLCHYFGFCSPVF